MHDAAHVLDPRAAVSDRQKNNAVLGQGLIDDQSHAVAVEICRHPVEGGKSAFFAHSHGQAGGRVTWVSAAFV